MTFLFRDQYAGTGCEEFYKITAESEMEAVFKVIKKQIADEHLSVKEVCEYLDFELVSLDDLEEYE